NWAIKKSRLANRKRYVSSSHSFSKRNLNNQLNVSSHFRNFQCAVKADVVIIFFIGQILNRQSQIGLERIPFETGFHSGTEKGITVRYFFISCNSFLSRRKFHISRNFQMIQKSTVLNDFIIPFIENRHRRTEWQRKISRLIDLLVVEIFQRQQTI